MPALCRHVLLSLKDYRRDLHEAVAAYAATAGWQVEYCGAQFRRGWCLAGRLLRPAQVIVSSGAPEPELVAAENACVSD